MGSDKKSPQSEKPVSPQPTKPPPASTSTTRPSPMPAHEPTNPQKSPSIPQNFKDVSDGEDETKAGELVNQRYMTVNDKFREFTLSMAIKHLAGCDITDEGFPDIIRSILKV